MVANIHENLLTIGPIPRQCGIEIARNRTPEKGGHPTAWVGSVKTRICQDTKRGRPGFTVAYYDFTWRCRREFHTGFEKAKTPAQLAATKLQNG